MTKVFKNSFQVPGKVLHYFTNMVQVVAYTGEVEEVKLTIRGQSEQNLQKQEREAVPVYVQDKLYVANVNRVYEVQGTELLFVTQLNADQIQLANYKNQLLLTDHTHFYILEDNALKRKKFSFDGSQIHFKQIQLFSFNNTQQIHTLALVSDSDR